MDPALQSRLNLWAPKEALIAFFRPNEICLPQGFFFFFFRAFSFSKKKYTLILFSGCAMQHAEYLFPNEGSNPCPLQWKRESQPLTTAKDLVGLSLQTCF